MVVVNGRENFLGVSPKLLEVGPGEHIVEEVNFSSILLAVRMLKMGAQYNHKLTKAQDSAGGACGLDIFVWTCGRVGVSRKLGK